MNEVVDLVLTRVTTADYIGLRYGALGWHAGLERFESSLAGQLLEVWQFAFIHIAL